MKKMTILVGEMRISAADKAVVHQPMLAEALGAEVTTSWPKEEVEIEVIVGTLLGNRKTQLLTKAEKAGIPIIELAAALTPDVRTKLIELLEAKTVRQPYERRSLDYLKGQQPTTDTLPLAGGPLPIEPPARLKKGKKSKVAASNA